ncbi:hypothetical protein K458DRAFT_395630 [Lentithecium fluviatile CBS 122367]|uniref:Uncharacterized protein n=1 Tax=Lentithecium fluviatile CBS 122367 TaxID=1168545 RepID=A0A6G1IHY0_9PLEO|nr:hypothetical protein K458DRAFT_395630 [Lentithecium fluviatile CBS 122367]
MLRGFRNWIAGPLRCKRVRVDTPPDRQLRGATTGEGEPPSGNEYQDRMSLISAQGLILEEARERRRRDDNRGASDRSTGSPVARRTTTASPTTNGIHPTTSPANRLTNGVNHSGDPQEPWPCPMRHQRASIVTRPLREPYFLEGRTNIECTHLTESIIASFSRPVADMAPQQREALASFRRSVSQGLLSADALGALDCRRTLPPIDMDTLCEWLNRIFFLGLATGYNFVWMSEEPARETAYCRLRGSSWPPEIEMYPLAREFQDGRELLAQSRITSLTVILLRLVFKQWGCTYCPTWEPNFGVAGSLRPGHLKDFPVE